MRCSERFMWGFAAQRLSWGSGWARRAPELLRCLAESFRGAESFQCDAAVLKRIRVIGLQTNSVIEIRQRMLIVVREQVDVTAGIVGGGDFGLELNGLS